MKDFSSIEKGQFVYVENTMCVNEDYRREIYVYYVHRDESWEIFAKSGQPQLVISNFQHENAA